MGLFMSCCANVAHYVSRREGILKNSPQVLTSPVANHFLDQQVCTFKAVTKCNTNSNLEHVQ